MNHPSEGPKPSPFPSLSAFKGFDEALQAREEACKRLIYTVRGYQEAAFSHFRGSGHFNIPSGNPEREKEENGQKEADIVRTSEALHAIVVDGLAKLYESHSPAEFMRAFQEATSFLKLGSDELTLLVEEAYQKSVSQASALGTAQVGASVSQALCW